MDILERTIGLANVSRLRTDHLGDRFELFGFVGKMLLTGKDVAANFLMSRDAYVLKALVGGDLMEGKEGLQPGRPAARRTSTWASPATRT